jgi:pyruvate formate lyase activating enzyme
VTLETGIIFDIERFSIHDGPGIRTTVFFKGCPLACSWCHNPESQSPDKERWFWERRCIRCGACMEACEHNAISISGNSVITDDALCQLCGACVEVCQAEAREIIGRQVTVTQVMAEIEKDVAFYDESGGGVTFSGGEPLAQPDFLLALLTACKDKEIRTAVDTSGFAPWQTLQGISPCVDLYLYDLKLMDDERHRRFTGVSNELILSNLRALSAWGKTIIVRVPIIPGVNDDSENITRLGEFVAALPRVPPVSLLPYHKVGIDKYVRLRMPYAWPEIQPPADERMGELASTLKGFGLTVRMGG